MSIGTFARSAGVGVETVRYYQRRGLLETPSRTSGGTRWYTEPMIARMALIRRAQALGFTLAEIKDLISLSERDCASAKELVQGKLLEVDARIVELNEMRKQLRRYVVLCDRAKQGDPCPFLYGLSGRGNPRAS